jgi:hypothetical protein
MKRQLPSVNSILSKISIDYIKGIAIWNSSGKPAGAKYTTKQGKSYRQIKIDGVIYPLHRIIAKACGILSNEDLQIDHVDGDGLNNKASNLRQVTSSENNRNRKIPSSNTSGVIGVNFISSTGKWQARINHNEKRISLGMFSCFDDAAKARKSAEKEYCYSKGHGTDREL